MRTQMRKDVYGREENIGWIGSREPDIFIILPKYLLKEVFATNTPIWKRTSDVKCISVLLHYLVGKQRNVL